MSNSGETIDRREQFEQVLECSLASSKNSVLAPKTRQRVAVCMSGGVDSSATALLLMQAGYEIVGVTGWLIKSGSRCCDTGMVDAARVCEQLGVEHHAVDLRELFKNKIMDSFHESYAQARTPLPCSVCNTEIKWGALLKYSFKHLDADFIATGHYARIVQTPEGHRLARSADRKKDQSYVLWGLTNEQLKRTLLPLGDYTKEQIREIAAGGNLVTAKRKDSQDLCFIPEGSSTQEYLSLYLDLRPGPIMHIGSGEILGTHQGTHNYTIGQRRGLGVAYSEPLYVCAIDPDMNIVYVGAKESLLRRELFA
ncbi:MAG: tRNA 2-thiouridine(34) synthase MnmA, partial [Candidatus Obscuribacterales bacterium]|nr:tRNA 2-thiouridine(34) synthase MnmA [Candidatus Obscuribacterales bacterium]